MLKRVLVVDDNEDMVGTTVTLLRLAGHESMGLSDPNGIIDTVLQFRPDVVILDLAMPGKDGFSAAREIRSAIGGKRPVLIAYSGERLVDAKERAKASGFNFYVVKPCDAKFLMALVAES